MILVLKSPCTIISPSLADPPTPHDPPLFDVMMIGSFTWGKGSTPDEVKDFVYEIGYKPPTVFVFVYPSFFSSSTIFCLKSP